MSIAVVTGSSGLIGSETSKYIHEKGLEIVGIDNDMRRYFFGEDASTAWSRQRLEASVKRYRHHDIDIRDQSALEAIFQTYRSSIVLVLHTAAQPSHDWAAREPFTDFAVNANGTLNLLEFTRRYAPEAV